MSDLLVMNFDCASSPTINLFLEDGRPETRGWGMSWFPADRSGASSFRDMGSGSAEELSQVLSDWRRFRSSTFLCKVRGAAKSQSQQDTQPFRHSFAGRDWLFLHNGELDKEALIQSTSSQNSFFEPIGTTDSEQAFCYLLQKFHSVGARRLRDVEWSVLQGWFALLDPFGQVQMALSDGHHTLVYNGTGVARNLYFKRRIPPHNAEHKLIGSHISVDFSDALDGNRTAAIVTSCDFNDPSWSLMQPGQMLVLCKGDFVWDSLGGQQLNQTASWGTAPADPMVGPQESLSIANLRSTTVDRDGNPLRYRSFRVEHFSEYRYDNPVEHSTHVFRMHPVEDQIQELVSSNLSFSVGGKILQFEDVFGNQALHVTLEQPYSCLQVRVESEVRIYQRPQDDLSSPMRQTSMPLVWMPWQRQMMLPYLLPPELPETQLLELTEFAMSFAERCDYDLAATLADINQQIFRDFQYVQGKTTLRTTPYDVYVTREGVCQDFANLFICLARLLNVPSRYRAGYIFTGTDYENTAQSEASHAWVEVYLPYLGWRGFDPTNGTAVSQEHIRVACGRNYRDATPTAGTIYKGGGMETLTATVKVEELTES